MSDGDALQETNAQELVNQSTHCFSCKHISHVKRICNALRPFPNNEQCEFSQQGNDQVRFEMTYYALYPGVQVGENIECICH